MRLLIDTLVAVMLAGVLAGVVYLQNLDTAHEEQVAETIESIRQIQQQIILQAALEQVALNSAGYPETVDVEWFELAVPQNTLLEGERPWLEVAGIEHRESLNPDRLTASDSTVASFWYNPYQGIVRARVPAEMSDQTALAMYNRVNGTNLTSLFPADFEANTLRK